MKSIELFFSYSHKDEELRDELLKHLSLLKRERVIAGWHDREISAGQEWDEAIRSHLDSADIILLLISSDFMASDFCYNIEVKRAMKRHEAGEARVIPVILRPVDWKRAPFGKLAALPKDGKPVTSWSNPDEAFLNIAEGIRNAVEDLLRPQRDLLKDRVARLFSNIDYPPGYPKANYEELVVDPHFLAVLGDPQEPAEEKAHFCLERFKQRYLAMRPRYEKWFLAQVIAQTRQADIDLYMRTYKSERDRLNNLSDNEYQAFWTAIAEQVTGPEPSSSRRLLLLTSLDFKSFRSDLLQEQAGQMLREAEELRKKFWER